MNGSTSFDCCFFGRQITSVFLICNEKNAHYFMSYLLLKRGILKIEMGHRLPSWLHSPISPSRLKNNKIQKIKKLLASSTGSSPLRPINNVYVYIVWRCYQMSAKSSEMSRKTHQNIIHKLNS